MTRVQQVEVTNALLMVVAANAVKVAAPSLQLEVQNDAKPMAEVADASLRVARSRPRVPLISA